MLFRSVGNQSGLFPQIHFKTSVYVKDKNTLRVGKKVGSLSHHLENAFSGERNRAVLSVQY